MNRTKPRMRRINVTVPGELVARAKAAGLNLSEVTRDALTQQLAGKRSDAPADDGVGTTQRARRDSNPQPSDP